MTGPGDCESTLAGVDDNERLTALRVELVRLYPTRADMERVLHDAGVDVAHVALEGSAANAWHQALLEAQRRDAVASIVVVASRDYPEARFAGSSDVGAPPAPPSEAPRDLTNLIATSLLEQRAAVTDFGGMRILFVDDEPLMLRAASQTVIRGRMNVTVHTADDGLKALSLLEGVPVDVIVTDLAMPSMSGEDFIAAVSDRHPRVPVVVLTGYALLDRADRLPHYGILHKPVRMDEVLRYAHRVCRWELAAALRLDVNDHAATVRTLLRVHDKIRGFLADFGADDVLETALRHKLKECVYRFSRSLAQAPSAAGEAARLEQEVDKLVGAARRAQRGVATGFARYVHGVARDFVEDHPALNVHVEIDDDAVGAYPTNLTPSLVLATTELLDNARDALDGRGEIRVSARARASERVLRVRVWSSKPIAPELAQRIFDEGVTTKGPGRGMGLTLVRALVVRAGGSVRLHHRDGAEFVLDLPLP